MDEPLSNLDAKLRVETRANIAALQQRLGTTTIYVTHDQVEAMTMGDRVAVLKDGVLQQCASPRELYDNPANAFVAGFIGSPAMNLGTYPLEDGGVRVGELIVPLPRAVHAAASGLGEVVFGVRPETLRLTGADEPGFELIVELVEELGADAYVHGVVGSGADARRVVVRVDGRTPPRLGEKVRVALRDHGEVHAFHPKTTERITG
jgi:multiple sugar transport system ATP-binding protein